MLQPQLCTMAKLSIIIITYNRPGDTLDLLQDIAQLNHPELLEDVIILNNASTDDYAAVVAFTSSTPCIPFVYKDAPENLGVAKGRNYATQFAKGDIWLFIDDDVNLKDRDSIPKVIAAFSAKPYIGRKPGVVSFKVLYTANMQMQVNALPHKQFDKYHTLHEFPTYYYAGCAHAKLKAAWEAAGPYPDNFFYGMEEYDFSFRLLDKGYCIRYDDSVTVLHKESPLGRTTKAEKLRMMWVNKCKVAWRYLPGIYFYSTAILWSVEYLRKSGFNLRHYWYAWKDIFTIPKTEKRTPVSQPTLDYLKQVEARLWY